jgi:hypothetical protein
MPIKQTGWDSQYIKKKWSLSWVLVIAIWFLFTFIHTNMRSSELHLLKVNSFKHAMPNADWVGSSFLTRDHDNHNHRFQLAILRAGKDLFWMWQWSLAKVLARERVFRLDCWKEPRVNRSRLDRRFRYVNHGSLFCIWVRLIRIKNLLVIISIVYTISWRCWFRRSSSGVIMVEERWPNGSLLVAAN